jgi:RNA polymerase sigma-70 factor (family 1)
MIYDRANDFPTEGLGKKMKFPGITRGLTQIEDLMVRISKHGDDSAFQALFNLMYPPLCQFCQKIVGVKEVAEELVSDVFYTVWKNRDRFEVRSPRSYLFTAVRNRALDYLRKGKATQLCDLREASHIAVDLPSGVDMLVEGELTRSLERGIATLPRQCKLIFELSREQGLKHREIASTLNISVKTVETQMGRALKRLHQSLPSIL